MSAIDVTATARALHKIMPFALLGEREVLLIAEHAHHRTFDPGHLLVPAGSVASALFVTLQGGAETEVGPMAPVFDVAGLLFGLGARREVRAGPDGLTALVIAKPHVFTIARECPEFIVGLFDSSAGALA